MGENVDSLDMEDLDLYSGSDEPSPKWDQLFGEDIKLPDHIVRSARRTSNQLEREDNQGDLLAQHSPAADKLSGGNKASGASKNVQLQDEDTWSRLLASCPRPPPPVAVRTTPKPPSGDRAEAERAIPAAAAAALESAPPPPPLGRRLAILLLRAVLLAATACSAAAWHFEAVHRLGSKRSNVIRAGLATFAAVLVSSEWNRGLGGFLASRQHDGTIASLAAVLIGLSRPLDDFLGPAPMLLDVVLIVGVMYAFSWAAARWLELPGFVLPPPARSAAAGAARGAVGPAASGGPRVASPGGSRWLSSS